MKALRRKALVTAVLCATSTLTVATLGLGVAAAGPAGAHPARAEVARLSSSAEASRSHRLSYVTARMVIRRYDRHGKVISEKVHHLGRVGGRGPRRDCAPACSGTERVGPTSGGTARADIVYTGRGTLGEKLWTFDSWSKWSWDHLSCPCTMNEIDHGAFGVAIDSHWDYDGIVASGVYDSYKAGSGGPHTAYEHDTEGQFSGPSLTKLAPSILTVHRRPFIFETDNNNGTMDWTKVCC